jgi:hypothetical protein
MLYQKHLVALLTALIGELANLNLQWNVILDSSIVLTSKVSDKQRKLLHI